jgi:hypothetical protein
MVERLVNNNIVRRMTIAGQQLGKHFPDVALPKVEEQPLLGNGMLDMFPQQRISTK